MAPRIRPAEKDDVRPCGVIMYEAFKGIAEAHNFPPVFPAPEAPESQLSMMQEAPGFDGFVAEEGGDPYLELVGDDARFFFQAWYEGADYEQLVRDIMAAHRSFPIEITDADVEVLGPDAGVVTGTYHTQPVNTAGESQTLNAAFTFVYERRAGDWLLVRGHESVVPEEEGEAGS